MMTWGQNEVIISSAPPALMELRSSYGWSLTDVELKELQQYQDELTSVTSVYLEDEDIRRLRLAVEIAYQSRAWTNEGRSDERLAHAVAVAKCLAELQMESEAVIAAILAGVCEDTGLALRQVDQLLGPTVAGAVRDVSNIWRLSELLQVRAFTHHYILRPRNGYVVVFDGDGGLEAHGWPRRAHGRACGASRALISCCVARRMRPPKIRSSSSTDARLFSRAATIGGASCSRSRHGSSPRARCRARRRSAQRPSGFVSSRAVGAPTPPHWWMHPRVGWAEGQRG